jgi:fatty acid desaturase
MSKLEIVIPRELRKLRNLRATADISSRLLLQSSVIAASLFIATHSEWGIFVPLVFANSFVFSFWGWAGIGHEFAHNTVFSSRRLNALLFHICGILTWSNPGYFEATHKRHHRNTLQWGDPEDQSEKFLRVSDLPRLLLLDLSGLVTRFLILVSNSIGSVPEIDRDPLTSREKRRIMRGARLVLCAQAVWILVVVAWINRTELILLTSLAPWICKLPVTILERLQHLYCQRNSPSPFLNTRTLLLPRPIGWLYANMNYHVEHHLFPYIPNYNLSKIHQLVLCKHEEGKSLLSNFAAVRNTVNQGLKSLRGI